MKRLISIMTVCICLFVTNVNAASLSDMTKKVMDYHKIEVENDFSGIDRLQNRRTVKNPVLISTAIKNGVLIAKNGLVNEDGTDYTPLINGLIKRYVNNSSYKFVSGMYVDLTRNKKIVFNDDTFFVTENSTQSDLNYKDLYTCIVNRENTALFVWSSTDIVQPAIYRAKLYWIEGSEMVVTNVYRKEFDLWLKENSGGFYTLDSSGINVSQDFILKNLDKYVYVFADNYGGKITVKGISE